MMSCHVIDYQLTCFRFLYYISMMMHSSKPTNQPTCCPYLVTSPAAVTYMSDIWPNSLHPRNLAIHVHGMCHEQFKATIILPDTNSPERYDCCYPFASLSFCSMKFTAPFVLLCLVNYNSTNYDTDALMIDDLLMIVGTILCVFSCLLSYLFNRVDRWTKKINVTSEMWHWVSLIPKNASMLLFHFWC